MVCALGPPSHCRNLRRPRPVDMEPCNTQPCHLPPGKATLYPARLLAPALLKLLASGSSPTFPVPTNPPEHLLPPFKAQRHVGVTLHFLVLPWWLCTPHGARLAQDWLSEQLSAKGREWWRRPASYPVSASAFPVALASRWPYPIAGEEAPRHWHSPRPAWRWCVAGMERAGLGCGPAGCGRRWL